MNVSSPQRGKYFLLTFLLLIAGFSIMFLLEGKDDMLFSAFSEIPFISNTSIPVGGIAIPEQSEWVDYGSVFEAGLEGDWDYLLYGGFTVSVVKKDGVFYLYYQGASGYRTSPDETVTGRAIGVATSQDGTDFTKAEDNPVLTWSPNGNGEEGAVSAGTALDANENIIIHYGANSEINDSLVSADVRAAVSSDGRNFKDLGAVIQHDDPAIWGSGDEIYPILSIHENDQWIVYYIPNGVVESGWLGVAWGEDLDNFSKSSWTRSWLLPVKGWGTGSYAEISPGIYAIFINNIRKGTIRAYLMSPENPARLSLPVRTYRFGEVKQACIYLDKEAKTWFMFYRADDYYGVKMTPAQVVGQSTLPVPSSLPTNSTLEKQQEQ